MKGTKIKNKTRGRVRRPALRHGQNSAHAASGAPKSTNVCWFVIARPHISALNAASSIDGRLSSRTAHSIASATNRLFRPNTSDWMVFIHVFLCKASSPDPSAADACAVSRSVVASAVAVTVAVYTTAAHAAPAIADMKLAPHAGPRDPKLSLPKSSVPMDASMVKVGYPGGWAIERSHATNANSDASPPAAEACRVDA